MRENDGSDKSHQSKADTNEAILRRNGEASEAAAEVEATVANEQEAEGKIPSSSNSSTPEGKIRFFADDEKKQASVAVYNMETTTGKEKKVPPLPTTAFCNAEPTTTINGSKLAGLEEQPSPLLVEKKEPHPSGEAAIIRDLKIAAATSTDVTSTTATASVNPDAEGNAAPLEADPMAAFLVANPTSRRGSGSTDSELPEPAPLPESRIPDTTRVPGALRVVGNGGGPAPTRPQAVPREARRGTSASRDELLLNARLVEDDEEAGRVQQPAGILVEAKPALEGFTAIVRNHRFKYVAGGFLLVLLGVVVPLAVVLPKKGDNAPPVIVLQGPEACASEELLQADYRGTISITEGNITCQRWDQQEPHSHSFFQEDFSAFALEENYCRNPDGNPRAWCYTTDPNIRMQYCSVPNCNGADELVTNEQCGTEEKSQADYRGTIAITATGKKCQRWDSLFPHHHRNTPDDKPSAGLEENYCRNPDGEPFAWCYTEDPDSRWEFCDVPLCGTVTVENDRKTCTNCTNQQCGTERLNQGDYRGNISTTRSGYTCQRWDSQEPHRHMYNLEDYPDADLDNNYCRNPTPDAGWDRWAFCLTTDPNKRFDYCDIPFCAYEEVPRRTCGTVANQQSDYRGDMAITESGKKCLPWTAADAIANGHTPKDLPWDGLIGNYCRNPGNSQSRSWCYVEEGSSSWEFCDVPDCQECGSISQQKQDYRGTISTTRNGTTCLQWQDMESDFSNHTLLEENFCRNPNGQRETVWCFIGPESSNWDYCDVPDCPEESKQGPPGNTSCGSLAFRQSDYRGQINLTASGRTCQPWSSQTPHAHKYSPEQHPTAGLDENYCRQPDGSGTLAWCFVDDDSSGVRWEHCAVPACEELSASKVQKQPECGTLSLQQQDYSGMLSTTKSGWTCQDWALQTPHQHRFSPERYAQLLGNACRNPDGSERAWCFTTNPDVVWEYCEIPICHADGAIP